MNQDQSNYNKGGMWALFVAIGLSVLLIFYVTALHPSIKLDKIGDEASEQAAKNVSSSPGKTAEVDVSKIAEPWKSSPAMIQYGSKVFKQNCGVCHGDSGMGNGVAGTGLVPPPRNLVEGKWKYQ